MVKNKRKRSLIIALSIAGILLIAVITVLVIKSIGSSKNDPYVQNNSTSTSDESMVTPNSDTSKEEPASGNTDNASGQTVVDPATLATIDIVPMSITVSYVKGIGGIEFEVLRAQNGTRYVQFSSPELLGTKCTNDTGVFASILASPTEAEASTLAKTVKVDGASYGLSLSDATCTADTTKLQKFQQAFSDGFSSLKKLN